MSARNPFQAPETTSRRGGPAKEPLSRDAIVTAALELLRKDGPEGMSLRKVAAALDTGPASLYVYVENLQELEALVLDRALADVKTGAGGRGWRGRTIALLGSYLEVLAGTPGLARLALGTIAAGPNALRITEALRGHLEEGGVNVATAAWAVDLLTLYATAVAAEHSSRPGEIALRQSFLRRPCSLGLGRRDATGEQVAHFPTADGIDRELLRGLDDEIDGQGPAAAVGAVVDDNTVVPATAPVVCVPLGVPADVLT